MSKKAFNKSIFGNPEQHVRMVDSEKSKHNPGYWKSKDDRGRTILISMRDMDNEHLIRAYSFADRQVEYHNSICETYMSKMDEFEAEAMRRGIDLTQKVTLKEVRD